MKYSVEVTENGFVETLEIDGFKFQKEWSRSSGVLECKDYDFCDQLKQNGETDEEFLEQIYDEIDCSFFASDVANIER